ncbi:uncharacterized protein LOC131146449 [Malania oleifera]|uniref:uncharacterized protein LOC131146449 n=1 Tax=Malania oleifera TaxID=397392 RepID=UPI0025AEC6F5|nr:uncharacterized protein LOC131146449 [Malania oleifera]
MEENNPVQSSQTHSTSATPPNTEPAPLPQTAPSPPPPPQNNNNNSSGSNKRKLADVDIHSSPFYKICALVHGLRPHFLEVLRTPDLRNCKGAHEIRKQMKLVMDLYKQMTFGADSVVGSKNGPEPLSGEDALGKQSGDGDEEGEKVEQLQPKRVPEKLAGKKPPTCNSEKKAEDGQIQGSYVVGGSVFGWNFITFGGTKPVYYGVTKELYRSNHPKVEIVNMPTCNADISNDSKSPVVT